MNVLPVKDIAGGLASFGRHGDTYMVHAAEGETVVPAEILEANPELKQELFRQMQMMGITEPGRYVVGNALNSINPVTGQPEFFYKRLFKIAKTIVPVLAAAQVGNVLASGAMGAMGAGAGGRISGALQGASQAFVNPFGQGTAAQKGLSALRGMFGGGPLAGGTPGPQAGGTPVTTTAPSGNLPSNFNEFIFGAPSQPIMAGPSRYSFDYSTGTVVPAGATAQNIGAVMNPNSGGISTIDPTAVGNAISGGGGNVPGQGGGIRSFFGNLLGGAKKGLEYLGSEEGRGLGMLASTAIPAYLGYKYQKEFDEKMEDPEYLAERRRAAAPQQAAIDDYGMMTIPEQRSAEGLAKLREAGAGPTMTMADLQRTMGLTPSEARTYLTSRYGPGGVTAAGGGEIVGPGTGTSDSIPARLSDGEFVLTADAVRGAGNGDRDLGAARMYDLMSRFEGMS